MKPRLLLGGFASQMEADTVHPCCRYTTGFGTKYQREQISVIYNLFKLHHNNGTYCQHFTRKYCNFSPFYILHYHLFDSLCPSWEIFNNMNLSHIMFNNMNLSHIIHCYPQKMCYGSLHLCYSHKYTSTFFSQIIITPVGSHFCLSTP